MGNVSSFACKAFCWGMWTSMLWFRPTSHYDHVESVACWSWLFWRWLEIVSFLILWIWFYRCIYRRLFSFLICCSTPVALRLLCCSSRFTDRCRLKEWRSVRISNLILNFYGATLLCIELEALALMARQITVTQDPGRLIQDIEARMANIWLSNIVVFCNFVNV